MSRVVVRRLGVEQWRTLRELRLAALAESPLAFASSLATEQDFDERRWRASLEDDRLAAVAFAAAEAVGLAGAWAPRDLDGTAELFSMWVRPSWRGRGVADLLVDEVLGWARERGHERVVLWVVEGNEAAVRLYRRHGFVDAARSQPHPTMPDLCERLLECRL